jgi:hypothetical protein
MWSPVRARYLAHDDCCCQQAGSSSRALCRPDNPIEFYHVEDLSRQLPLRRGSLRSGYGPCPRCQQMQLLDLRQDTQLGHRRQAECVPADYDLGRRRPERLSTGQQLRASPALPSLRRPAVHARPCRGNGRRLCFNQAGDAGRCDAGRAARGAGQIF